MKVKTKMVVHDKESSDHVIVGCECCCRDMEFAYSIGQIVSDGSNFASLKMPIDGSTAVYELEIKFCPWCGTRIEYVLIERVRRIKHETQRVVNDVTYTEEPIG